MQGGLTMDAQLKKGVLELCLLQCLSGEPKYGYDVIQTMRDCFPDVTESTFYAILRRLAREGAADTFQGSESNGPVRKYYRLTRDGRGRYDALLRTWRETRDAVAALGIQ